MRIPHGRLDRGVEIGTENQVVLGNQGVLFIGRKKRLHGLEMAEITGQLTWIGSPTVKPPIEFLRVLGVRKRKSLSIDRRHSTKRELTCSKPSLNKSPSVGRGVQVDDERAHASP